MRRRLLFLSHRVPFPPHNGAAIRTFNLLRELSEGYEIDALCFNRIDVATESMSLASRVDQLEPFAKCEVFDIPQQRSLGRLVLDHACSVSTQRAYTWYLHASAHYELRLAEMLRIAPYDVIHVDSMDLVRFLRMLPLSITACTHHNIESDLLERRATTEVSLLRRTYLLHQSRLLRRLEKQWTPRVAINLCTSARDADTLLTVAPDARIAVVPNGVDGTYFAPQPLVRDQGLVFVGGTSWYPNKDALEWFVSEVLPVMRSGGITSPVTWVGRITEAEKTQFATVVGLRLTGYVDDVRPYLARAECFVAPIRVGGGTRLKILDAWAMGVPVVGTSAAMEGVDAVDGVNCLIADTPDGLSVAVRRVLDERLWAAQIGLSGRRTIETRYTWERIGKGLREHYDSLACPPLPGKPNPHDP